MTHDDSLVILHHGVVVVAGIAAFAAAFLLYGKKADFWYIAAGAAVIFFFFSALGKILETVIVNEMEHKRLRDVLHSTKRRNSENDKGDNLNVEG